MRVDHEAAGEAQQQVLAHSLGDLQLAPRQALRPAVVAEARVRRAHDVGHAPGQHGADAQRGVVDGVALGHGRGAQTSPGARLRRSSPAPEAGGQQGAGQRRGQHRLTVHLLHGQTRHEAPAHGGGQRGKCFVQGRALRRRAQAVAAGLHGQRRAAVHEHHERAGTARRRVLEPVRPAQRRAVELRGVGGGQHHGAAAGVLQAAQPVHGARQRELGAAQALHEVAAARGADGLQRRQRRVERGEAAGKPSARTSSRVTMP